MAGQSQGALEPALEAFAEAARPDVHRLRGRLRQVIERALEAVRDQGADAVISQNVSQQFGLVAVRSGAKALAFPLRREGGAWKVETPGPITFQILGPQPGSSGAVAQVAVEVKSPGVIGDAVLFVDGKPCSEPDAEAGNRDGVRESGKALPPGDAYRGRLRAGREQRGRRGVVVHGDEAVAGVVRRAWERRGRSAPASRMRRRGSACPRRYRQVLSDS